MATHSSIPAWKIPRTEEPGKLQSRGHKRVGHDSAAKQGPFLEFQSKYLTVKGAQCFLSLFDYGVLVFDHKALLRNDIPYCFYRSSVLSRTF